ncbi:MAG: hypothetical protein AAF389_09235 [Gemmatimonadota bacterium]
MDIKRTVGIALGIATVMAATAGDVAGQDDGAAIEAILDYSLVDNILGGQSAAFLMALSEVVGPSVDLEAAGVATVVAEEFAPERMRDDVVGAMLQSALPVVVGEVSEMLRDGAIGQVSSLLAEYEPPESLEAFVDGLQREGPPRERVELIASLADAQQAAGFYLLLDERARESAHEVAAALTGGGSPEYEPLDEAVEMEQLQRGFQFAIVSFLHRYRPVDDELVASATAEYETAPGQWYVENYSLALAESIRLAALRVVERVQ